MTHTKEGILLKYSTGSIQLSIHKIGTETFTVNLKEVSEAAIFQLIGKRVKISLDKSIVVDICEN
ncbi:hypothetical protein DN752_21005 [Echinicola strongylocentroti]|uniref:Uncharacterized protein n=1 Tax=Echinicola strongylocentroti TaxID=1795355 RepID=A0A2Z4IMT8_9BACT|nr:hypothetical protein [Echinicola strongylocentroti]AWW32422.1 hypothetical protein DN752_21005 [Echinicola strongylocentroti]